MNNIFFYVAAAGYTLAAIFLITAIVLFLKYDIWYVVKDLNGTIAQKEISALRNKAASEKNSRLHIYDSDRTGRNTGKETSGAVSVTESDTEMKTSILKFNRVINKDFVIVTDIVSVNTDEVM